MSREDNKTQGGMKEGINLITGKYRMPASLKEPLKARFI
jgi:hypothetical protein